MNHYHFSIILKFERITITNISHLDYIFHIISLHEKIWTQQIDLSPNVWLHSSVGRALHRHRGGHGFESRWSPDIFLASSFQLLELENLLQWSLFTFIYKRSTIWFSCIFHERANVVFVGVLRLKMKTIKKSNNNKTTMKQVELFLF